MYEILGWINAILLLFMATMFPIRYLIKNKHNKNVIPIYRVFRKLHPLVGILIIVIGMIHGYLALGRFKIHSGSILITAIVISAIIAYSKDKIKYLKRNWRNIHKILGILIIFLFVMHLTFPYYI
jgi:cytochrome b561